MKRKLEDAIDEAIEELRKPPISIVELVLVGAISFGLVFGCAAIYEATQPEPVFVNCPSGC